jgi:hypothetical protein
MKIFIPSQSYCIKSKKNHGLNLFIKKPEIEDEGFKSPSPASKTKFDQE